MLFVQSLEKLSSFCFSNSDDFKKENVKNFFFTNLFLYTKKKKIGEGQDEK